MRILLYKIIISVGGLAFATIALACAPQTLNCNGCCPEYAVQSPSNGLLSGPLVEAPAASMSCCAAVNASGPVVAKLKGAERKQDSAPDNTTSEVIAFGESSLRLDKRIASSYDHFNQLLQRRSDSLLYLWTGRFLL